MKTLFNFLIALWCMFLTLPLAAQQDTNSITGWFRWAYEPLDKTEVLSDILIQQTPVFIWPGIYDGIHVHDTLALNRSQWGWLYGQFIAASVDTPYLPNPAIYVQPGMTPHLYGQPVQLMYMATRYDMIREGALADTLVYIEDDQWYDVENRSESPYIQDTCYALAPLHQDVWGLEMTLVLSDSLLFNNLGWAIDSFEIDAGDGLGWRIVWPDSLIVVTYGAEGRKEVRIRMTHGTDTFLAQTYLLVKEYDVGGRSGEGMPYDVGNPEKINLGGVELSMFSACADKKLHRPLIVVEGYPNFPDAGPSLFGDKGLLSQQGLNEWLNDREYDIIWVDWLDNSSSVATQANRLINVIEWVNNRKRADGSNEPNVMIGASFGGLVGKYALLRMHNILNRDSEVETFFTFDSPLKGANFPVGIQAFLMDLEGQVEVLGASSIEIQEALSLIQNPAPRDMLIKRVELTWDGVEYHFALIDGDFQILQNKIEEMEITRTLGEICRFITLSNGADMGNVQAYLEEGEKILEFKLDLDELPGIFISPFPFPTKAPEWCYDLEIRANAYSADEETTNIYDRTIIVNKRCGGDDITLSEAYMVLDNPLGLDNAPGGNTSLGLNILKKTFDEIIPTVPDQKNYSLMLMEGYGFIPTVSSLDMPLETNRYTNSPEGGPGVLRWSASTEATPLTWDPNLSDYNQDHVSMDGRIAAILTSELEPATVQALESPLQTGEIYNFGKTSPIDDDPISTSQTIDEDITLVDGAELWINRFDKIGYINSSNPENASPQSFHLSVPGVSCEGDEDEVIVIVGDGGRIVIGDVDGSTLNTGQLSFLAQSNLRVIEGGEVILTQGSLNKLILVGGQMSIEEDGFVDARWGSRIIIHDGSTLTVKTGGTLRISHYSALEVEAGGFLVIEPGAIIQLWDGHEPGGEAKIHLKDGGTLEWQGSPDFTGNGYFRFEAGSAFLALDDVLLTGMGKGFRFMRLGGNARVQLEGVHVAFEEGAIEYETSSGFYLDDGSLEATDMKFIGELTAEALVMQAPTSVAITSCTFEGVNGIYVNDYEGGIADFCVDNCEFEACASGINASNSTYVTAKNSDFTDCDLAINLWENVLYFYGFNLEIKTEDLNVYEGIGIQLYNASFCRLHKSTISNYAKGIEFVQPILGNKNISNVFLYDSSIRNCEDGIRVNDGGLDPDRGLVLMDCSDAVGNDFAVRGKDVLLSIDAVTHGALHTDAGIVPNYFSLVPYEGVFFQVCYKERDDIMQVLARENRWNGTGENGLPDPMYGYDYVLKQAGLSPGCGNGNTNVPLIFLKAYQGDTLIYCPEPPRLPEGPGSSGSGQFATSPDTSLHCTSITTSIPADTFLVHNAYIQGMHWFYWEDFDLSYEKLEPVAAIPDTVRGGMSGRCQHYIDVARVMVDALAPLRSEPDPLIGGPISDGPTSVETTSRLGKQEVYPNPARGTVTIIPAHGTDRLKIVNAQGLEITEIQGVVGERILSVADWPEGLYMVISLTNTGRVIEVTRMVVNR